MKKFTASILIQILNVTFLCLVWDHYTYILYMYVLYMYKLYVPFYGILSSYSSLGRRDRTKKSDQLWQVQHHNDYAGISHT